MAFARKIYSLIVLSLAGWLLAGCGGGGIGPVDISDAVVSGTVRGRVQLDSPLVGAVVVLKSRDGKTLRGTATTDQDGRYAIETDDARRGLQVMASGGTTQEGAFKGSLSTYIEPFIAEYDVNLSPVTTLANRYRTAGGKSMEEAKRRIVLYLNLTPGRSIYADFSHGQDFNSVQFMHQARGQDFDAFVGRLVTEALASEEAQRSFPPLLGGWEDEMASSMAMDLVRRAAQFAGPVGDVAIEFAAGHLLSLIFGGKDDSALEAVFSKLNDISRQLDALAVSVSDIRRELDELKVLQRVTVTEPTINTIKTVLTRLQSLKGETGELGIQERRRVEELILSGLGDDKIMIISNMLNGELGYGAETPIMTYGKYLVGGKNFWSQADANKMKSFIEFYDALNIQMYYLVMEAENAKSIRETGRYSPRLPLLLKELETARKKYIQFVPKDLPTEEVFIDMATSRMWTGPYLSTWGQYANAGNFVPAKLKETYPEWKLPQHDEPRGSFTNGRGQGLLHVGFPEKLLTQKIGKNSRPVANMGVIWPRSTNRQYSGCQQFYEIDRWVNPPDIVEYISEGQTCHYVDLARGVDENTGRILIQKNPAGREIGFYLNAKVPSEDMKAYIPWVAVKN
jgi:hypothetical protein